MVNHQNAIMRAMNAPDRQTIPHEQACLNAKLFKQVVGVDVEPVLFSTVDDSDVQVTGLPVGATVKLQIVATNSVGDAPASEVVQLQAA